MRDLPVHTVTIGRPFYLGKYEVIEVQWEAVMGPTSFYRTGNSQPAEFISWSDAQGFCQQVSTLTGRTARLPTEAEWEYACRANTATDCSLGNDPFQLGQYAWYAGNSASQTHDVGDRLPNACRLYDMLGNVWEMCQDWYGPYDSSATVDPIGPAFGTQRVARGGAYGGTAPSGDLRCSVRNEVDPTRAYGADAGFRLAVDAPRWRVLRSLPLWRRNHDRYDPPDSQPGRDLPFGAGVGRPAPRLSRPSPFRVSATRAYTGLAYVVGLGLVDADACDVCLSTLPGMPVRRVLVAPLQAAHTVPASVPGSCTIGAS